MKNNSSAAKDLLDCVRIDLTEEGGTRSMVECDTERLLGMFELLMQAKQYCPLTLTCCPLYPPKDHRFLDAGKGYCFHCDEHFSAHKEETTKNSSSNWIDHP